MTAPGWPYTVTALLGLGLALWLARKLRRFRRAMPAWKCERGPARLYE